MLLSCVRLWRKQPFIGHRGITRSALGTIGAAEENIGRLTPHTSHLTPADSLHKTSTPIIMIVSWKVAFSCLTGGVILRDRVTSATSAFSPLVEPKVGPGLDSMLGPCSRRYRNQVGWDAVSVYGCGLHSRTFPTDDLPGTRIYK